MTQTSSPTAAQTAETARLREISFLNLAHGLDHFVLLIYPTVVIGLELIYNRPYSELIALSSTAFIAFGVFALPAGWLADRWSRRNMMAAFYFGCGASLIAISLAPNLLMLSIAMFMLGVFAAIYHPVGMAMLIEASGAKGRTLAFNGVCGNLGVSLAAGISGALAYWIDWRAAFYVPALVLLASGAVYVWMTPDDRHRTNKRVSKPAVPLTPKVMAMLFTLFLFIALTSGLVFNVLTIALPKMVDEGMTRDYSLVMIGSIATAVLICGALAQLAVGRVVEKVSAANLFVAVTAFGFIGNLWATYATGIPQMVALAIAVAAIYGQVTVNDIILARYTADAWRGRVYAVRYFTLFISAGIAIAMISLLHKTGGFGLVLGANAIVALCMFLATLGLVSLISGIETRHAAAQPAE
ncbi:MAG: MFS transporter [Pseudolabrys sp.]|nr:MFS transporter [Pseudolabrys sp.]MDP2295882.1 MFS transporter [Pseudolabrys sp.]